MSPVVCSESLSTFCVHWYNSFDFWFGSSKTFAKSFHPFSILSSRNYPYRNIRHRLRHLLEWVYRERWAGLYFWMLKWWHNLITYSTWFPSFRHFRHRHRGKKVEPLLRVCGIAHCTWLSFETKHEGNFIVGCPTNYCFSGLDRVYIFLFFCRFHS